MWSLKNLRRGWICNEKDFMLWIKGYFLLKKKRILDVFFTQVFSFLDKVRVSSWNKWKRNLLEDCKWIILTKGWYKLTWKILEEKHHSKFEWIVITFSWTSRGNFRLFLWYKI